MRPVLKDVLTEIPDQQVLQVPQVLWASPGLLVCLDLRGLQTGLPDRQVAVEKPEQQVKPELLVRAVQPVPPEAQEIVEKPVLQEKPDLLAQRDLQGLQVQRDPLEVQEIVEKPEPLVIAVPQGKREQLVHQVRLELLVRVALLVKQALQVYPERPALLVTQGAQGKLEKQVLRAALGLLGIQDLRERQDRRAHLVLAVRLAPQVRLVLLDPAAIRVQPE